MGLRYKHGDVLMVDYTPSGADVTAGDIVLVGNAACVAHTDIPDGELGALAYPSGTAVYEIIEATSWNGAEDSGAIGTSVYVEAGGDLSNSPTSNFLVGVVLSAYDDDGGGDAAGTRLVHGG